MAGRLSLRALAFLQAMLLLATLLLPALAAAATIQTDLFVYQDGDTVSVTGVDYGPNEVVDFVTTDPNGIVVDDSAAAGVSPSSDDLGNVAYSFTLHATVAGLYTVVGTGAASGYTASTEFDPASVSVTNQTLAWFRDAGSGFDLVVNGGTYGCTSNGNPSCTSPTSLVIELRASDGGNNGTATGSVVASKTLTGLTNGSASVNWGPLTFQFRSAPSSGQFPIPGDGMLDVKATFNYTGTNSPQTASRDNILGVDNTAPSISNSISPAAPNGLAGWYTTAPTVTYVCSDATSGLLSGNAGCSAAFTFGNGSGLSNTGTATDKAGNTASSTRSGVNVDTVVPSISASLVPAAPAGTGWYNKLTGRPTVSYTCGDSGSGLASCTSPALLGEGTTVGHTGTATDVAGNSNSASVANLKIDVTDPLSSVTTLAGGAASVSANGTASDALSGLNVGNPKPVHVEIRAGSCSGLPISNSGADINANGGNWSYAAPAGGFPTVAGTYYVVSIATDIAGNIQAVPGCSPYTISSSDTIAPDTIIDTNPANPNASSSAAFTFHGSDNVTPAASLSFECKIDAGSFGPCTSPDNLSGLAEGSHTFSVRAKDAADNVDASPATYTWVVDTIAPDTTIDSHPTDPSSSSSAGFTFHGTDGGSGVTGFECKIDAGSFGPCTSPDNLSGLAEGSHTFSVRAKDAADNVDASPATYTWVVDTIAPDTTCDPSPLDWQNAEVTIHCISTDEGAGVRAGDEGFDLSTSVGVGNEDGSASTGTHEVCDLANNCATAGPITGLKVDLKAPQLSSCDAADGSWHASNVTLYCHYADGGSGPSTQDVSLSTSIASGVETTNASASAGGARACDGVGNCATSPSDITGNKIDRKAPQSTGCDTADSTWHANDVTLKCHYSDGGSGPSTQDVSLSTNVTANTETANASASANGAQACDAVNNCAPSPADIPGNMIDKKAPQLSSCDAADGSWHGANVTLKCTYTDGGSGPGSQDVPLATNVPAGTETSNASASAGGAKACDGVGNCAASPSNIGGNKIDLKAPTITCPSPAPVFLLNQSPANVVAAVTDGGSGAPATSSSPADTSTVGVAKSVSISATDAVGNSATTSCAYGVAYQFFGFYAPIDNPILVNTGKGGRTYPVKWSLKDANNNFISSLSAITDIRYKSVACGTFNNDPTASLETTATGGTVLRYDATANQFIYNWATPSGQGCYQLYVYLADGNIKYANFNLSK